MSKLTRSKLQRGMERELRAAGLSYEIQASKKHRRLMIDGVTVMVFSNGPGHNKDLGYLKKIIKGIRC